MNIKCKMFRVKVTCQKCRVTYIALPLNAKYHESGDRFEGWYFTCPDPCGSTHCVPVTKAEIEILDDQGTYNL